MQISKTYEPAQITTYASIAIFLMWVKLFYWMRLFESLAAFIRLISQTIYDTRGFSPMFIICIAMFANQTLLLDMNRTLTNQDSLIEPVFGVPSIDSFVR